jgi:hypothetical protein
MSGFNECRGECRSRAHNRSTSCLLKVVAIQVIPFCRNGRSAKPNRARMATCAEHQSKRGLLPNLSRFAPIHVEQVAAGRDALEFPAEIQG